LGGRRNVKVVLLYPQHQSWPDSMVKPNGSLAYPQLGGALLAHGIEVKVFDACVGNDKDDLESTFYRSTPLPTGLLRTGVSDDRILEEVADYDIIGLTSIFSAQETMVLTTAALIKKHFPAKLIVAGGVNARARKEHFFARGVDLVCLSEADRTIIKIVDAIASGSRDFSNISAIAYRHDGVTIINKTKPSDVIWNLDEQALPAWELLPNERYWKIGRPHGGVFAPEDNVRYASMMTSLGCIFACTYCHIAGETEETEAGPIGKFRVKSDERVLQEVANLKAIGANTIYIEDDTLFGHKKRGIRLLRKLNQANAAFMCINGLNIAHLMSHNEPDEELIEVLAEAGVKELDLPFESATPRILAKYSTNKWSVTKFDMEKLIAKCRQAGIRLNGAFMIGFPDETRDEIETTIHYAERMTAAGLNSVNVSIVLPLPGTPMYDQVVAEGKLSPDFDIDKMHWMRANMINTPVPPEELEQIQREAWERLNTDNFKSSKKAMRAAAS
jgi:anaerobic magnesium-protoporphyrin IX monomethyl ester cyclase